MKASDRIKLGMFVMPIHDPEKPLRQCIDEDLELAVKCDELGFDEFWVGEHHSSTIENIVMPEIFIASALAMTSTIRLGAAPVTTLICFRSLIIFSPSLPFLMTLQ